MQDSNGEAKVIQRSVAQVSSWSTIKASSKGLRKRDRHPSRRWRNGGRNPGPRAKGHGGLIIRRAISGKMGWAVTCIRNDPISGRAWRLVDVAPRGGRDGSDILLSTRAAEGRGRTRAFCFLLQSKHRQSDAFRSTAEWANIVGAIRGGELGEGGTMHACLRIRVWGSFVAIWLAMLDARQAAEVSRAVSCLSTWRRESETLFLQLRSPVQLSWSDRRSPAREGQKRAGGEPGGRL